MDTHVTYLLRVWLPDRPGALGLGASRIGALKGDLIGLEVMEREGGLAIDELVVSLPRDVPIRLVVNEVCAVEEVEVEDVQPLAGAPYDPQIDLLEVAAIVLGAETRDELATALTEHLCRAVRSTWACVVEGDGTVMASSGDRPNDRWLQSFIAGSPVGSSAGEDGGEPAVSMEAVWLPLPAAGLVVVVGADNVIRARERHRLAALARIADAWFRRLKERSDLTARALHPSGRP